MKKLSKQLFVVGLMGFLSLISNTVQSQCGPLTTPYLDNNGQDGIMFDIVALQAVNITQFAMDFTGTTTVEVYGIAGTHVGNEVNAGAWTLIGTAAGLNASAGTNVIIPVAINSFICPGDVAGFYITSTTGGCNYSDGAALGSAAAADANIQILEGTGKSYPFGLSFTPRVPNVTVYYDCATSCCLPPIMAMTPEICVGSCDGTATAAVGAGGVSPYSYQWDDLSAQTTQTAIGLCAGTYSVDVTDNTGCISTNTVIVTSGATSSNATINPVGPFCESDAALNLSAVDPGGTWSGPGITDGLIGSFDPNVAGIGAHTITYTIAGPCGDTQTTTLVINPLPTAIISVSNGPVCEGQDAVFSLTGTDGADVSYTLNGALATIILTGGTATITTTAATADQVLLLQSITDGICSATLTETLTITVNPTPTLTLTAVDPTNCNGTDGSVDVTGSSFGSVTIAWSGAATGTQTTTLPYAVTGLASGNYDVFYTNDLTGCVSMIEQVVLNNPGTPIIDPIAPYISCEVDYIVPAITTGTNLSGNQAVYDAPGGPAGGGVLVPVGTAISVSTTLYAYDESGICSNEALISITINPLPNSGINGGITYCSDDAPENLFNLLGGAPDLGGTWSPALISGTGVFDPFVDAQGTYAYTVTNGCGTSSTDVVVTIAATLTAGTDGNIMVCDTDPSIDLFNLLGGAPDLGGTWLPALISGTGVFDPSADAQGPYTYSVANLCGTSSSDVVVTITVNPNPGTNGAITLCDSDASVDLFNLLGGNPDVGGTWSPALISGTGIYNPSSDAGGIYTYSITTSCGVFSANADVTLNASDDATFGYSSGVYCINVTNPIASINVTNGGVFTISSGGVIDATNGTIDLADSGPGTYGVTYSTAGPCPDVFVLTITILDVINPTITLVGPFCSYDAPVILQTSQPGGLWSGTGVNSLTGEFNPSLAASGINDITYTIDGSCIAFSTIQIEVIPTPIVSTIADTIIMNGNSVNLITIGNVSAYSWTPGTTLTCDDCQSPIATPNVTTTYIVNVEENGCVASDEVTITIDYEIIIYVPNAFTPNGDGQNDIFIPIISDIDPNQYEFMIFNRWGELIFESQHPSQGWDGYHKGVPAPDGTYVWKVSCKEVSTIEDYQYMGHVTLIK